MRRFASRPQIPWLRTCTASCLTDWAEISHPSSPSAAMPWTCTQLWLMRWRHGWRLLWSMITSRSTTDRRWSSATPTCCVELGWACASVSTWPLWVQSRTRHLATQSHSLPCWLLPFKVPVVTHKAVQEVSKWETYRRGWLLWIMDGRAKSLMDLSVSLSISLSIYLSIFLSIYLP